jgi:hypothetical protein
MKDVIRFVKFIPSDKADWLREKHPFAFLLLSLIAQRARRYSGHLDGLEIGDALIGDFLKAGIPTEAIYRTAKKTLVKIKAIKIKETNRIPLIDEILTTRTTTIGTLVTLLNLDIWDINPEDNNESNNDSSTSKQRFSNDEQERKKKEEKMKKKRFKNQKTPSNFKCLLNIMKS